MMLRGASSFLNSGFQSRNTSQSASQSSLTRGNATEEKNELESYLSTFKDKKRTAKKGKINWEKLLQDGGSDEEGIEVGDRGLGESESAFLKPKSREAAGNGSKVSVVSKAKATTASGMYVHGDDKRKVSSHHIAFLDSRIRTLGSSTLVGGSGGSASEIDLSENTYSDGNLLANVVMADEFLLSEDESQAGWNKLRVASELNERGPSSQQKVVGDPSGARDDASKSTMTRQTKENVFSVDHLKKPEIRGTLLTTKRETSLGDSESETSSSLALKLKNVHTLDDLELAADSLESTTDSCLATDMMGTDKESLLTKVKSAVVTSETKNPRPKPTSGFRFSAPGFGAMQTQSDTIESANHNSQSTSEGQEDCTNTYTYNDDDFESESIAEVEEEEEEVIEEELHEEDRYLASDDKEDSHTTSGEHLGESTGLQEVTGSGDFHSDGETHDQSPSPASAGSEEEEPSSEDSVAVVESETYTKTSSCEQGSVPRTTTTRTPGVQDAAVQTPLPAAWPTIQPPYGREYLDPSPIVPHVVSADALEAITAYSPSTVALNDMLRAQLMLTRQLITSSRQTLEHLSANLSSNHHYTTLEDTKDFIARNKPRVLTTREAKKLVMKEEI